MSFQWNMLTCEWTHSWTEVILLPWWLFRKSPVVPSINMNINYGVHFNCMNQCNTAGKLWYGCKNLGSKLELELKRIVWAHWHSLFPVRWGEVRWDELWFPPDLASMFESLEMGLFILNRRVVLSFLFLLMSLPFISL